ncbi:MAG: radical SAM protein, partial [Candidatus Nealsonbacteria bacterium]|nr:radical SAM protein [Candidatus Nealsonbacteria bacterium]
MKICGLQKTTLIDFPGRPAATIFLCGCNFRCPWCYAPHLVLPSEIKKQLYPPQVFAKQKFGRAGISEEELFDFLEERKEFLDAVTICGGEPCLNKDLPEFCRKIKKLGYLIKLDTNGSNPEM